MHLPENVKEDWEEDAFSEYEVVDENGEKETMWLAERQTTLNGKKKKDLLQKSVTVREIRKRSASGHQTAIVTTNYMLTLVQIAMQMFTRWCKENFFKYVVERFGIESITSYIKRDIPDTSMAVNLEYKSIENEQKQTTVLLFMSKLKYAWIYLSEKELFQKEMGRHILKKAQCKQEIDALEQRRADII